MWSPGVRYMMLATFFFALMNVAVKWLVRIPAIEVAFLRSGVSLLLAWVFVKAQGVPLPGNNRTGLLLRGLFGSVSLILYFISLQHLPLASAVTVQYLSPIFTAILGIYIVKEPVRPVQWLYFAISFAGVIIVQGFDDRSPLFYVLLCAGSAMFAALSYNSIRQLKLSEHPLVITFYFPLVSLPVTGLLLPGIDWVTPSGEEWLVVVLIGICAQTAQYFMTRAYQAENLSRVVPFKYLGTIYALIFGYLVFGETFGVLSLLGLVLVLAGVLANARESTV